MYYSMIKREALSADWYGHSKWFKINIKETEKLKKLIPGDQGQHDMISEDKNYASYNWRIRNN